MNKKEKRLLFVSCLMLFLVCSFCLIGATDFGEDESDMVVCIHDDKKDFSCIVYSKEEPEIKAAVEIEEYDDMHAFWQITWQEREYIEKVVMGEAGGEPFEGKKLVAQTILNNAEIVDIRPDEACRKFQYSGWNENPTDEVKRAVKEVFDYGDFVTDEPIRWFYAYKYTNSVWHEAQDFVIQVGGHRFFK